MKFQNSVHVLLSASMLVMAATPAQSQISQIQARSATLEVREMPALPMSKSMNDAVQVIERAESREVSEYLNSTPSQAEVARFETDLRAVASANERIGFAKDALGFNNWWSTNRTQVLLARGSMRSSDLQGFFTEAYIAYMKDKLHAEENPQGFMKFLSDSLSNPVLRAVSMKTFGIVAGVVAFATGIVYGATVAGPVAGFVGAFLEPVVRPVREKIAVVGNRLWAKPGLFLNEAMFNQKTKVSKDDSGDLEGAKKAYTEARGLVTSIGYDFTPAQFAQNIAKVREAWNLANQVWNKTNPEAYRNGRNVLADTVIFRPQHFSLQVMQSVAGAETFRQSIEAIVDRVAVKSADPKSVESASQNLQKMITNEFVTEGAGKSVTEIMIQEREALRAKLIVMGASDEQVSRIIDCQKKDLAFSRHAATVLAAEIFHDLQFEELNRAMPDKIYDTYKVFKAGYAVDYFHQQFSNQVVELLNQVDFELKFTGKQMDGASRARAEQTAKAPRKTKANGGGIALVKTEAPLPETKAEERAKSAEPKVTKGQELLERLNRVGANMRAARGAKLKDGTQGTMDDEIRKAADKAVRR